MSTAHDAPERANAHLATRNLVQTLRNPATVFYEYAADGGALLKTAAARIEALEAALREISELYVGGDDYISEHRDIARAALKQP